MMLSSPDNYWARIIADVARNKYNREEKEIYNGKGYFMGQLTQVRRQDRYFTFLLEKLILLKISTYKKV